MSLDLGSELGDQVLRLDAEEDREDVCRSSLNCSGGQQPSQQPVEEGKITLTEYIVDQIPDRGWKHEPTESIDENQEEAESDEFPPGPDDLFEGVPEAVPRNFGLCQA